MSAIAIACALAVAPASAMSPPATVENISVLVVIVDFADEPRPPELRYKDGVDQFVPLTVANVQDVFFDNAVSSAARYAEMSHGLLTITGNVIEVAIALNLASSDVDEWRVAAEVAAASLGHPVSNYDRVAYLVPYGFEGQIGIGGALGNWCWISAINLGNAYLRESVFSHELGHTLSLEHASAVSSQGTIALVADESDFMGRGEGIHTASVNQWNKGWLDGARNALHPTDSSATYEIYPLAETASALQVVHVDSHGALPALGDPHDTLITFRKPIGFDDNLSLVATGPFGQPLRNSVHLHQTRKSGSKDSYLVRAMGAGDQYETCGLTIAVQSIDSARAQVQLTQTPYAPVAPSVQVWPQGATAVEAGNTLFYDLDVTNFDVGTGACEAFYDQVVSLPGPGWTAGWPGAGQDVRLSLGAMETFANFSVRAPVGTTPGVYNVSLELTNNGGSGAPVTVTADFPYEVLPSPDIVPPTAPTNLVANEYNPNYVVLMWTGSTDDVAVHTYRVYHNSVLLPDGGATTAYIDFPPPSGGYTPGGTNGYVVHAVDAAGNVSPPSNWAFVGDDLVSPSTPTNLVGAISWDQVSLDWDDSTDNVGVTNYDIHRDGVLVGTSTVSEWVDQDVVANSTYSYTVFAWDGYGNVSGESAPFLADLPLIPFSEVPSISPVGGILLVGALIGGAIRTRRRAP